MALKARGPEVYRSARTQAQASGKAEERAIVPVKASSEPAPVWVNKASAQPSTAQQPVAAGDASECCICFDAEAVANVRFVPCGHTSCANCVVALRRRSLFLASAGVPCPFCRTTVTRYDAPYGVDVGDQPAAPPAVSLALRVTLPPLEVRRMAMAAPGVVHASSAVPAAEGARAPPAGASFGSYFEAGHAAFAYAQLSDLSPQAQPWQPQPPSPPPPPPPQPSSMAALGGIWEMAERIYNE